MKHVFRLKTNTLRIAGGPCVTPMCAITKFMGILEDAVRDAVRAGLNKEREVFAACVVDRETSTSQKHDYILFDDWFTPTL